tara:strand:- start:64423 stop:64872 length:450 start_codon:yes stop_codon:yes gene_type:complete
MGLLDCFRSDAFFLERLSSADPGIQSGAMNVLVRRQNSHIAERLRLLLTDSRSQVRANAAGTLGLCGGEQDVPTLGRLLVDDDWFVRAMAASGLGYLASTDVGLGTDAGRRALLLLSPCLADESDAVRSAARIAMDSVREFAGESNLQN